ncbi:DNA/RNA non-specific endonuclease [Erwinia sp. V71]|uniref:DNA/RNA non-specific endonuclease n=1 Tax=Erwinia sp. V71 TaxID=3369424 RepID=UPI003F644A35
MKLRLLHLLPILLLAGCAPPQTPQPPQTITPEICAAGCPTGGSNQTLVREAYVLNNNAGTKFANWVAYKVSKTSQASNRPRNWKQDPDLPADDTLAPAAYNNASATLKVDRGHQAPLASLGNADDWQTLNYLSNITPQKSALNQGAWARLEDKERVLASRDDIAVVNVVTGPLYEYQTETLPNAPAVQIPSGYWKVIFIGDSPDKGEYAAFLLDQNTVKSASFCESQVTVATIEAKTAPHLVIWPALPAAIAQRIKAQKGTLAAALGCP